MSLLQQYRESLKVIEAEEIFDLLIYRPAAFLFVKIILPLPVTPNQVSTAAMFVGVAAGVLFGYGKPDLLKIGAVLYFLCNTLDCADGQIARLKRNGTKIGRIVDGFIDYIVSIAVFLGVGIGLIAAGNIPFGIKELNISSGNLNIYIWVITILAGISSALQAFYFDLYRNNFLEKAYGKFSSLENEMTEFEEERAKVSEISGKYLEKFLIFIYLKYTRLQFNLQSEKQKKKPEIEPSPEDYYRKNRGILRAWSFIGSTTHITICIICALLNRLELFLLICIIPLNILMLVLILIQNNINKKLLIQTKVV